MPTKLLSAPHPIPYQGSKRRLASPILKLVAGTYPRLYEPFAGSAAITLAAAQRGIAKSFVLGDSLDPLAQPWALIIDSPSETADRYREVWSQQLEDPKAHFLATRDEFNQTRDPVLLLYLVARCVKNAVRFNSKGGFSQSADHRRRGMSPDRMDRQISCASELLKGRCEAVSGDYGELLDRAKKRDLVYMDPPYQGVSTGPDKRYAEQLDLDAFLASLEKLNRRSVDYLLSFDGTCGDRSYGEPMPKELRLAQVMINAGRSSQATLAGRSETTVESLYVSPSLKRKLGSVPKRISVAPPKTRPMGSYGAELRAKQREEKP